MAALTIHQGGNRRVAKAPRHKWAIQLPGRKGSGVCGKRTLALSPLVARNVI